MAEFDLRDNHLYSAGWPIDGTSLEDMVYRVIAIIGSSKFLYDNFRDDGYLFDRMKEIEMAKLSELLIAIAIICRSLIDSSIDKSITRKDEIVGTITENEIDKLLTFRESCNKIVHAREINFDIEENQSIRDGFLNHFIYLYGNMGDTEWKATIDLIKFCKQAGWVM